MSAGKYRSRYPGMRGKFCSVDQRGTGQKERRKWGRRIYKPEEVVNLLQQAEVAVANGKITPQGCKEASLIHLQPAVLLALREYIHNVTDV